MPIVVDIKAGSSEGGATPVQAHTSGAQRGCAIFAPTGHRHEAEVAQALGLDVHLSVTSIELVRGVWRPARLGRAGPLR